MPVFATISTLQRGFEERSWGLTELGLHMGLKTYVLIGLDSVLIFVLDSTFHFRTNAPI
jgi:hypothetical protein